MRGGWQRPGRLVPRRGSAGRAWGLTAAGHRAARGRTPIPGPARCALRGPGGGPCAGRVRRRLPGRLVSRRRSAGQGAAAGSVVRGPFGAPSGAGDGQAAEVPRCGRQAAPDPARPRAGRTGTKRGPGARAGCPPRGRAGGAGNAWVAGAQGRHDPCAGGNGLPVRGAGRPARAAGRRANRGRMRALGSGPPARALPGARRGWRAFARASLSGFGAGRRTERGLRGPGVRRARRISPGRRPGAAGLRPRPGAGGGRTGSPGPGCSPGGAGSPAGPGCPRPRPRRRCPGSRPGSGWS